MSFLRRISLPRLLVLSAVAVLALAGVALAASSGGAHRPRHRPLADAIRRALAAPPVAGVTATISFTDNLLGVTGLTQQRRPLIAGGSGRLWAGNGQVRLELQSDAGDTEIYFDHGSASYFDPSSRTLYRVNLPQAAGKPARPTTGGPGLPNAADIQKVLQSLMAHAGLSGAQPTVVAGQPAYRVRITPRNGGLVGGVALAWDALHGIPLDVAVYATHQRDPVLQLTATSITYGAVDPSVFTPPIPAKTVDLKLPTPPAGAQGDPAGRTGARHAQAVSIKALRAAVAFPLSAPDRLAGMPRTGTALVRWGGRAAALVTYGRGLGGVVVLEQSSRPDATAKSKSGPAPSGAQGLPAVKVNGSPGSELSTPLGTFVRFTRAQVSFTLLGSVPARTAMAVARGL